MTIEIQIAIKRALKREGSRFRKVNRYFNTAYDYTLEKDKRLSFLQSIKKMPLFILAFNQFGDFPRGIYLGNSPFPFEKDSAGEALHINLDGGLALVIDPKTKQIMAMEKEVQARVNEFFWLLIRKRGYTLDYQWVIKLWQALDIYTIE